VGIDAAFATVAAPIGVLIPGVANDIGINIAVGGGRNIATGCEKLYDELVELLDSFQENTDNKNKEIYK
jgi:phosphoribosylcarboxyaminoimidazole (NCAIR) mutase